MLIKVERLEFHYSSGDFSLEIPILEIDDGETVAVIGPSGSGKTTLLNLISACDAPHKGTIKIGDKLVSSMNDEARRNYRICNMGLVFQEFELLSYLSVLDNILLPYRIASGLVLDKAIESRALKLTEEAGIADKATRRVDCLSQGERQRVAVCRALVTQPSILLCDEPTGNLDPDNRNRILDLMFEYAKKHEATLISVTHDHEAISRFERTLDITSIQNPAVTTQERVQ